MNGCICRLVFVLCTITFSHGHLIYKERNKAGYDHHNEAILHGHDAFSPFIGRPRYVGEGKRTIDATREYKEIRKLANDESAARHYIILEDRDIENGDASYDMEQKRQSEIYGKRHRYRFLLNKFGRKRELDPPPRAERFGKEIASAKYISEDSEPRWGRFGRETMKNKQHDEPRWGRFGRETVEISNEPRWGRFGRETVEYPDEPRWGRFGGK